LTGYFPAALCPPGTGEYYIHSGNIVRAEYSVFLITNRIINTKKLRTHLAMVGVIGNNQFNPSKASDPINTVNHREPTTTGEHNR
jgi:hypothetical protein